MQNRILIFTLLGMVLCFNLRCVNQPVACADCLDRQRVDADAQARPYTSADWGQGDDRVAYIRKFERAPATAQISRYKTNGDCGGFPRIDVKTAPGFCVGLVYDGGGIFRKLRWAAPLSKTRAVLTEMGGWAPFNGQILQLDFADGKAKITPLLTRASFKTGDARRGIINEPNQISRGPDGRYYVGAMGGIFRFDPAAANVAASVEVLVGDLPSEGLHPLKSFTFDHDGHLFVNVGSASNVCQNFTRYGDRDPKKNPRNHQRKQFPNCPEVEDEKIGQGQIRRYSFKADGTLDPAFLVYAKGLRNSIALTWGGERQVLLAGENARDAINKFDTSLDTNELPHERLTILRQGAHYGWPYCYDDGKNSPEWTNVDCSKFEKPQLLLPAHSAPLGFLVYRGDLFPAWYKGRLLATLHGYAPHGHRLVTFLQDERGLPVGVPQSVIYDWEKRGFQEIGKPVGLTELEDGSVLIVEDDPQNKVLRLVYDPKSGDGAPVEEINHPGKPVSQSDLIAEANRKQNLELKINSGQAPPFALFQHKVIDKTCYECHQAEGSPGVQLIPYDDIGNERRIRLGGRSQDILNVVSGASGVPAMPPQGWDSPEEQAEAVRLLQEWIMKH